MKTIGVIVYTLTNEYSLTVMDGITKYFEDKNDVNLIIADVKTPSSSAFDYEYQYWSSVELLKSKSVDAIIVVTNTFLAFLSVEQLSKYLEPLLPKPIISVATPLKLRGSKCSCSSCEQAYDNVVEHLKEKHGRSKIAFFSASLTNSEESKDRENAYKAALKNNGLSFDKNLIYPGDFTPKCCFEYIQKHFKSKEDVPFDAILCANDYMAVGCIGALQSIGVRVPEDVCVFGFDDTEVAVSCNPTVSTINQHIGETGARAAELAYKALTGEKTLKKSVIDCYPVYRQSCGCIAKDMKVHGYLSQSGDFVNMSGLTTNLDVFGNGLNDMDIVFNQLNMVDSITNIDSYFQRLKTVLKQLHIELFSLSVYEEPIHVTESNLYQFEEEAKLLIQIDNENGVYANYFDQGGLPFDLKNRLVPETLAIPSSGKYFLSPVFKKNSLFGYLICKIPATKYPLYVVCLKMLVNAFISAYEFSKNEQEKLALVEKNQNLNYAAKTDELTQLFNRRGFQEYGQQLIDVSVISEKDGSVFFCDLDGLKTINDTWGHEIGDLAIKTEAKVLRAAFRDSDLIGRLSGDEFAVVAPGFPVGRIDVLKERLVSLNKEFSEDAKLPFTLSISVGAVTFNSQNDNLKKLLTKADKFLYEEKKLKHPERHYK